MQRISTCLWYDSDAHEAAEFYCSVVPDSEILEVAHYGDAGPGEAGKVLLARVRLAGTEYTLLNGGPIYKLSPAVSITLACEDQEEIDHFWAVLSEGGAESQCGWLTDRFGLSWQVVPAAMGEILGDPDPARAERAMRAMLGMRRLDIAAMLAAKDG